MACVHEFLAMQLPHVGEPAESRVHPARSAATRSQYLEMLRESCLRPLLERREEDRWPTFELSDVEERSPRAGALVSAVAAIWHARPTSEHPILSAPAVAAAAAVDDVALRPEETFWLRQARRFDPDWFDRAHAFCLACMLGIRYERSEAPFDA